MWPKKGAINFSEIVSHDETMYSEDGEMILFSLPELSGSNLYMLLAEKKPAPALLPLPPPPFLNPLKSYGGQPGRRRFGLDDDDEE